MIAEELKVKITADTSDFNRSISQVKKQATDVEDSLGKGSSNAAKSSKELSNSLSGVREQLTQLKSLNFADLITENFDDIKKHASSAAASIKLSTSEFKNIFNFKGFKEGGASSFKDYLGSMKESYNEFLVSFKNSFSEMGKSIKSIFSGISKEMVALGAAVAAIAGEIMLVVGLVKNAMNISAQMKEINSEAKKIGMSSQSYQEWVYVLDQCGVEADKLSDFVKTLTEEQIAARNGSEDTIQAFEALGMAMEDVNKYSQEELFTKTVEGLQGITDEGYRTHLAYTLLGEDAAQINGLLYLNSEQTKNLIANYNLLGGVASQRLIERSSILQSSLSNMRGAWQGVKNTLAEAVLPAITAVVNAFTKAIAIVNLFLKAVLGVEIFTSKDTSTGGLTGGVDTYTDSVNSAITATEKLKRTTMGFDELNIVNNPNSSSGGDYGTNDPGSYNPGGGADYGINTEDLGLSGLQEWFNKYKTVIQDITTWSLIGIGVVGAVLCLIGGNWVGAIAFAGMAGIGLAVGSVEGGTFDRLKEKLTTWWEGVKTWFNDKVKPVFTKEYWKTKWENIKSAASEKLATFKKAIDDKLLPLKTWFNDKVKPIFTKKYWNDKWDKVKTSASEKLATFKKAFDDKLKTLKTWYEEKVKPIFTKKYWNDKWDKVKESAKDKLTTFKKAFTDKLKPLKTWYEEKVKPIFTKKYWNDKWDKVKESAGDKLATFKKLFDDKLKTLKTWFNDKVKPIFTKKYWVDKFDKVKEGISDKVGQYKTKIDEKLKPLKTWFNNTLKPLFTKKYWQDKFDTIRAGAVDKLGSAKTAIDGKWKEIKTWWSNNVSSKFTLTYWKNKFDVIRSAAATKVGEVKGAFSTGWTNTKTWWNNNVSSKFTTTYWTGKFDCIKSGAKAAFNGIISAIEGAVNNIIRKINTLSWKVPDWVPKIGGNTWGFNFSEIYIPRLATGGIATRSTLANIGEAGKEAVLPLENNTQWMDVLADKIAARSGGQAPSKIVLQVGEKELGWATIRSINQITKQTGGLQLVL